MIYIKTRTLRYMHTHAQGHSIIGGITELFGCIICHLKISYCTLSILKTYFHSVLALVNIFHFSIHKNNSNGTTIIKRKKTKESQAFLTLCFF